MPISINIITDDPESHSLQVLLNGSPISILDHVKNTSVEPVKDTVSTEEKSSCCDSPIIRGDAGEFRCTTCFSLCELSNGLPPIFHKCCGSRARRHKLNCPMSFLGQKNVKEDAIYECDNCGHVFEAAVGVEHTCPNCGSEDVWKRK